MIDGHVLAQAGSNSTQDQGKPYSWLDKNFLPCRFQLVVYDQFGYIDRVASNEENSLRQRIQSKSNVSKDLQESSILLQLFQIYKAVMTIDSKQHLENQRSQPLFPKIKSIEIASAMPPPLLQFNFTLMYAVFWHLNLPIESVYIPKAIMRSCLEPID